MSISYIRKEFEAIADLIEKKNKDYGDAFAEATKLFRDYPASKIYEKTKRIIQLSKEGNAVHGEGLTDALRDCIGYCVLYLDHLDWMDKARNGFSGEVELPKSALIPIGSRVILRLTSEDCPQEIKDKLSEKEAFIHDYCEDLIGGYLYDVECEGEYYVDLTRDDFEVVELNTEPNENNP